MLRTTILVGAALFAVCTAPASAQTCASAVDAIRPVTVKLSAEAQAVSGPNVTQMVDADATGVIVSEAGHVLTVEHLITELGDVAPETLNITARVGNEGDRQQAWVLDSKPNTDLLLLKLRRSGPYPSADLGTALDLKVTDELATFGFPAQNALDAFGTGEITSQTPDGGYLWATSLNFAPGQSGSPVFDCGNGLVVALAKGESRTSGAGLIIPIDIADPLLVAFRLEQLRREYDEGVERVREELITSLGPLQRQFDWRATRTSEEVVITYDRAVLGGPKIDTLDVTLHITGVDPNGSESRLPDLLEQLTEPVRSEEDGSGLFIWPINLNEKESMAFQTFGFVDLRYKLELGPTIMEDGDEKALETVVIDLPPGR